MPLSKNRGPLLTSDIYGEIELIPKEYLAKIGMHREEQEVPLDITPDLLVSPLVLSQVIQTRTNERKKTNISLIGDLEATLDDDVYIAETCQIGHHERHLVPEGTPLPEPDCTWQSGEQHNLGNGFLDQSIVVVDELFPKPDWKRERPVVTPEDFRAQLQEFEQSALICGTGAPPDPFEDGDGLIFQEVNQVDACKYRATSKELDQLVLPKFITNYSTNKFKQLVVDTRELREADDLPPPPTGISDTKYTDLGDGTALVEVNITDPLFTEQLFEESRPEVWPERFRALVPLSTDTHMEDGTASDPTLLPEDVRRAEQQEDDFTKRVSVSTRSLPGLPTDELHGQEYEDTFDVILPYDEWIDTAGVNLGSPRTVVTPQGDGTDHVKRIDYDSIADALAAYSSVFPGTTSLNNKLPDILTNLASVFEVNSGNGSYSETGAGYWSIRGSYSLSIRGSGNGSAAVVADADFLLTPPFFPVKQTTRVVFFLPNPVTPSDVLTKLTAILGASVSAWPNFDPKPVTVVCTSRKVSVRAEANQHTQSGGSSITPEDGDPCTDVDCVACDAASTTGTGTSTEVGITIKTIRVPPSLHAAINLHDTHDEGATAQAYAYDGSSWGSCVPPEFGPADTGVIDLTATGSVDSDAAATPLTAYPSSGLHLLETNAQTYKYNHTMIHAEVFDFADL